MNFHINTTHANTEHKACRDYGLRLWLLVQALGQTNTEPTLEVAVEADCSVMLNMSTGPFLSGPYIVAEIRLLLASGRRALFMEVHRSQNDPSYCLASYGLARIEPR